MEIGLADEFVKLGVQSEESVLAQARHDELTPQERITLLEQEKAALQAELAECRNYQQLVREQEQAAQQRAAELTQANKALLAEVAARQQIEVALRESEQRFRSTFEQAAVGMVIANLEGQWLQVNQRFCALVGYTSEELLSLTFERITHPHTLAANVSSIPGLISGEISHYQTEKRYIRKDGSSIWVYLTVSVARDEAGVASYFIVVVQDISQRKEAELVSQGQKLALQRTLNFLATEPELDKFLGQALTTVTEQLDAAVADIWLDDSQNNRSWLHLTSWQGRILTAAAQPDHPGASPLLISDFQHYSCWQSLHEQHAPYVYHDLPNHPEMVAFRAWAAARGGVEMALLIPLVLGQEYLGTVMIGHLQDRPHRPEEVELATALAQQVVLALQLTRLAQATQQAAIVEERNRMAREIHDTLAQTFTSISIQLNNAQHLAEQHPEVARDIIEQVKTLAHVGLSEARRSVWSLHPDADEYRDLASALQRALQQITAGTSLQAELSLYGTPCLVPPDIGMNLLRIAQEAATNTLRYAHAQNLLLELCFEADAILLRIKDDGIGFDPQLHTGGGGFGLLGMQQRCARLGGQFSIISQPGAGTEILVQIPIAPSSLAPL